jgi:holo-ACP synthase
VIPLTAILEAREQRWRAKQRLARRFRACALSLCLNIPGPDKNPPEAEQAFALVRAALREAHEREVQRLYAKRPRRPALKHARPARWAAIMHETGGAGADGPYWLALSPLPGFTLKRMAVRLESEHPLGRLADVDVLTKWGRVLSRADLGLAPRRCFLCGEPAALCRRNKEHPPEMLLDFTASLLKKAGTMDIS